jgi:hypothetical protein
MLAVFSRQGCQIAALPFIILLFLLIFLFFFFLISPHCLSRVNETRGVVVSESAPLDRLTYLY